MKNITFNLIVFTLLMLNVEACKSDDDVSVSEDSIQFASGVADDGQMFVPSTQTSTSFNVKASSRPTVTSASTWVTGSATEPNYPSQMSTVTLEIEPNTDTQNSRTAVINISVGQKSIELTLIQEKAEEEAIEPDPDEPVAFSPWINPDPCEITGSTPREVAASLGVGWNLGNQMDAFSNGVSSETCWGNPKATQALFNTLKARGFSTVRIPVTWMGHIGNAPDYKIDNAWLDRVVELVDMAEAAGLNAVINMHHDGSDSHYWLNIVSAAADASKNREIKEEISALWTQIAQALKDKGNFLMFEAFNEIHDGGWGWGSNRKDGGKQYGILNEWNQTFVDAVRATGGNNASRWLSVPSYVTNIDLAVDGSMKLPFDPANRVMVAVHFYEPNDFGLNSIVTDWGHTGDKSKKGSAIQDEDYMKGQFAKLTNYWVNKGTPVYIGETGSPNQATPRGKAFRNYYLEYMHRAAREAGLAAFYWDNGASGSGENAFGMFNHADGTVINDSDDAINAMILGGTCRDNGYSLDYIYNNAPIF